MDGQEQFRRITFDTSLRAAKAALAMATLFAVVGVLTQATEAQTFSVIHSFMGGQDGANPYAGLTLDAAGNLYGTSTLGGMGAGTVFKLRYVNSGWIFTPLYSFTRVGREGLHYATARAIIGSDGSLYGTTQYGGQGTCDLGGGGCGTVYNLKPSPSRPTSVFAPWNGTVLYAFAGDSDGGQPGNGDLVFDQAGNLYGTTLLRGFDNNGTVYELTPSSGNWTESVVYTFTGANDGSTPNGGVIFDTAGNLYGTTSGGGLYDNGTVYQLTPSGSGWTKNILYNFQGGSDGGTPIGGLIFDASGNLYGTTGYGGSGFGGVVFELTPSNGSWTYNTLYSFSRSGSVDPPGPEGSLYMDAAGNLYGTTLADGAYGDGSVFKLTPSNGSWTYTSLYDFTGGSDGCNPWGSVLLDAKGNLFGTASSCGAYYDGVVFEITP